MVVAVIEALPDELSGRLWLQAMHFMLPGMDGMPPAPQSQDDADAFQARVDAVKVRQGPSCAYRGAVIADGLWKDAAHDPRMQIVFDGCGVPCSL